MISKEYNKLKNTPSGQRHSDQWDVVKREIYANQREFVLILIDPGVQDSIKMDLISIAGHGGSIWLKDNWQMVPLLQEVWKEREMLSERMISFFQWLIQVHGYPLDQGGIK